MEAAREVGRVLAEMDSAHAPLYAGRTRDYLAELERLDDYVRAQAARVPEERRVLITAHDAFSYFGRAYGFDVRGLQGISTASEAGTADVQRLAEFVAARRIPAMFVESSVSPRSVQAVQAAVRARGFEVVLGGSLYSDAMGTPGTPDGTYPGMVRHNIDTIVAALLR
jgi:manganese/zinc/iron transport system substrate-binding protein